VRYSTNEARNEVEASRDAILVFSDSYYPGWIAEIDGSPTAIYRANITQRAVVVSSRRAPGQVPFPPCKRAGWILGLQRFSSGILGVFLDPAVPEEESLQEGFRAIGREGGRVTSKLSYYFEMGCRVRPCTRHQKCGTTSSIVPWRGRLTRQFTGTRHRSPLCWLPSAANLNCEYCFGQEHNQTSKVRSGARARRLLTRIRPHLCQPPVCQLSVGRSARRRASAGRGSRDHHFPIW